MDHHQSLPTSSDKVLQYKRVCVAVLEFREDINMLPLFNEI